MMQIYIEREFDKLHLEKENWNRLVQQSWTNTIFQTYEWTRICWDIFRKDSELLVIVIKEGEELVGLAPLMIVKERYLFRNRRVIQFIGAGISDYCDFIAKKNSQHILFKLIDYIFRGIPQWDEIRLVGIPEQSASCRTIEKISKENCLRIFYLPHAICPALTIKNNYQYARSVSHKKSLMRRQRYFRSQGKYEVFHLFDPIEIEKYLNEFFEQHISRWEKSRTPSLFLERNNRLFYEELVKKICSNKWLIFTVVKDKGVPIAFHFGFVYNNVLTWYKPTFNQSYSKYSPGQVLLKELLDYAIDSEKDELDFTVGNEPFKRRFSNTIRKNISVSIYQGSAEYEMKRVFHLLKQIGLHVLRGMMVTQMRKGGG